MKELKINRKIFIILIFIFLVNVCDAQTIFQKSYINTVDIGYSIQSDNSGFVIAGTTSSSEGSGGKDVLLLKTDLNGEILWAKAIGGVNDEMAYSIKKTSDDGYIIVGSTASYVNVPSDNSNFYIIKTDAYGSVQWTRAIGSNNTEVAKDVIETWDNKFAVVGFTRSIGPGNEDVYFVGLDSNGNLLWSYGMGSSGSDLGNSLVQTSTNEFIIVGSTTGFGAEGEIPYLIKTSEEGELQNPTYTFDLNTNFETQKRYFTKIINGYFNDFAITGSVGLGSIGDAQHFILDIGQDISLNWMKKYILNSGEGVGTSIEKTADGGFIMGGTMGIDRPALIKTDEIGQLQATMVYSEIGSSYHGKGLDVKPTMDGGYTIVGFRYNSSDTSLYLIKVDSELSSGCEEQNNLINDVSTMNPEVNYETATFAAGSNYIAIDSGVIVDIVPLVNIICETVGIDNHPQVYNELKILQSNNSIDFRLDNNNDFIHAINIYDVVGLKLESIYQDQNRISTIKLSPGIYFYHVVTNNMVHYSGKFIVQ